MGRVRSTPICLQCKLLFMWAVATQAIELVCFLWHLVRRICRQLIEPAYTPGIV